ncbi:MAG TPA: glycosyltransferase family 2 protein [Burkholderiales bacterium]|nr:glycosyltransferase family 2 protein [Burkholderiales bacterium]
MLDRITPLILTYNEEANIRRLMESLSWARRVVVVDSGSSDATRAIVAGFANASCVVRPFDNHAGQWNFGLTSTGIETEWVLALDADYGLPAAFVEELKRLDPPAEVVGLRAAFRYCIEGVPLRGGLYPPVVVLFRRARARYREDGHTQRVEVDGRIESFATPLLHDDRKPLERWFWSQSKYMRIEAAKLLSTPRAELQWPDRIRKLVVVAPVLVFFYCLIARGNLLDGRRGLTYALQRAAAEAILSLYLVEAAMRRHRAGEGS